MSNLTGVTEPSTSSNSNEAIMAMLCEIRESNAALARRIDMVEDNNSTPINPRSHTLGQPPISPQTGSPGEHRTGLMNQIRDPLFNDGPTQSHTQPSASDACFSFQPYLLPNYTLQGQVTRGHQPQIQQMDSLSQPQGQLDHFSKRCDTVIPSLQVLREIQGCYEERAHSELAQGKQNLVKRSGRYYAHDSVTAPPHLC